MDIENIILMYNQEHKSLKEIGEILGKSKSTILRHLANNGYKLNKETKQYEKQENTVSEETNVSNETIKMVNRTYAISEKLDRAMRIKAAIDGKKPIDIVREALENYIDDKYFEM